MDESSGSEVIEVFGANLRRFREGRGWSQSELARQMQAAGWPKYSQVAVSRTEEGTRAVRLDEALALGRLLDRTVNDLLDSKAVVDAWARLRWFMDVHSSQAVALRRMAKEFQDSYTSLLLLSKSLESTIEDEGGGSKVSEPMTKTLSNAQYMLSLDAHAFVDQGLDEWAEEDEGDGRDGVDQEAP